MPNKLEICKMHSVFVLTPVLSSSESKVSVVQTLCIEVS